LLADTLQADARDGMRHAIGFTRIRTIRTQLPQYRENVAAAQKESRRGRPHIDVTFVGSWFDITHSFIEANAAHCAARCSAFRPVVPR